MAAIDDLVKTFVKYVQDELFRRPFLNTDANQETVMVRRGGGPRQLTGVSLTDDQVLGRINGVVTGISIEELSDLANGNEKKMVFEQTTAQLVWTIVHGFDSILVESYIVDTEGERIHPDSVRAIDNATVRITFTKEQAGTAFLRWYN